VATGRDAGERIVIGGDRIDPEGLEAGSSPRCASASGFSLHANVAIAASDRSRLERLIRYTARPPLATERLEVLPEGRLLYRFKQPWRNGATYVTFEPLQLLEKLAALVPAPRANLVRYHGILGPAATWRPLIVPGGGNVEVAGQFTVSIGGAVTPEGRDPAVDGESSVLSPTPHGRNYAWAQLMSRVYAFDVLACSCCGGRLRIIAAIHPPEHTRKILDWLKLPSKPPPVAPAVLEPELTFGPE
jgi:hypothetical protein